MKRTAAIAFAVLLAGLVVLIAATTGIGKPSLPDGAVAYVEDAPDGEITQEDFDTSVEQSAARQGVRKTPEPGTPQYDQLKEAAMADLLLSRWVAGEADEMGIQVSDREIETELDRIIEEQFGNRKQFERFKKQQKFSDEDVNERVRLQLLSTRVQEKVLSGVDDPSDSDIQAYYDENIAQFETPETRDVRTLLNPKEDKAQQAADQLADDSSPKSWKQVTKKLSTDEATADQGGLREGVVQGQNEPALDEAIFAATEGELVGPIETEAGFYVLQVDAITPASTQELDDQTSQQISQALASQNQQRVAAAYQEDFLAKWKARTVCADDFMIDRCGNAPPPPDACQGDDDGEEPPVDPATGEPTEGCPAPVPSTRPVPPSEAGKSTATGLPQGPQFPEPQAAPGGLPGGLVPGAPPGAQGAPPGAPPGG